jgi:D-threo-aldose 1-dehydrogenase
VSFKLESLCQEYTIPLAAVLQFLLRDERLISTVVGISKPERLIATMRLAQLSIPEELWKSINEVIY